MRILHPTDFSRAAELAHALAVDLARRTAAQLQVVHVQEKLADERPRSALPVPVDALDAELRKRAEDERQSETHGLRQRLSRFEEGGATVELLWGNPLRELLRLAAEHDLVVMGAHGQNPFDEVFLGGIAGRLVRRTSTPVLTVRETCPTDRVRRLLVATDFKEAALAAWTFSVWFAERSGVKLVLAHVDEGPEGAAGSSQARLEALSADRAERIMIAGGNPIAVLPELAVDAGADAIVVGMKRHGAIAGLIMGARGDALVRSSPIPVLSVPAT